MESGLYFGEQDKYGFPTFLSSHTFGVLSEGGYSHKMADAEEGTNDKMATICDGDCHKISGTGITLIVTLWAEDLFNRMAFKMKYCLKYLLHTHNSHNFTA